MMTHGDRKGKSERETSRDEEINRTEIDIRK